MGLVASGSRDASAAIFCLSLVSAIPARSTRLQAERSKVGAPSRIDQGVPLARACEEYSAEREHGCEKGVLAGTRARCEHKRDLHVSGVEVVPTFTRYMV